MHTFNGLEMAHLQPLYARLANRPALLAKLQSQWGLRSVAGQGKDLMATSSLLDLFEMLHAEGEPHVGAWLALQSDLSTGHGIAYYLRSCATLEAALHEIVRLRSRLLPDGEFGMHKDGQQLRLVMRPRYQARRLGRQLRYEAGVAWLICLLSHCMARPLKPQNVELMTPETEQAGQLAALFGVMPHFGRDEFAVCYPLEVLGMPLPGSNPALLVALRPSLDYLLPPIRHGVSATERLRQWLHGLADPSRASQTSAARAFNCGTSSLRRRLASEGSSFSALLQADRRTRVLQSLAYSEEGIDAIARRLGYADRTTLERAFLGWFACRPVQLRSELAAAWPDLAQRRAALESIDTTLSCDDAAAWLAAAATIEPRPQANVHGPRLAALLLCAAGAPAASIRRMRMHMVPEPS